MTASDDLLKSTIYQLAVRDLGAPGWIGSRPWIRVEPNIDYIQITGPDDTISMDRSVQVGDRRFRIGWSERSGIVAYGQADEDWREQACGGFGRAAAGELPRARAARAVGSESTPGAARIVSRDQRLIGGRVGDVLDTYGLRIALAAAAVFMAVGPYLASKDGAAWLADTPEWQGHLRTLGVVLIIAGVILVIAAAFWEAAKEKEISALEADVARLKSELGEQVSVLQSELDSWMQAVDLAKDGFLHSLGLKLSFGAHPGTTERITIYTHNRRPHDSGNGYFVQFGRFCQNPRLQSKGRDLYPDDIGRIAETWQNQWDFANDYPDPNTEYERYLQRCREDGIPRDVAERIRMKSRLFFGYRVMDTQGRTPRAVVILEATDPNRYTEAELREFFGVEDRMIREVVERFQPRIPHTANAREAGL